MLATFFKNLFSSIWQKRQPNNLEINQATTLKNEKSNALKSVKSNVLENKKEDVQDDSLLSIHFIKIQPISIKHPPMKFSEYIFEITMNNSDFKETLKIYSLTKSKYYAKILWYTFKAHSLPKAQFKKILLEIKRQLTPVYLVTRKHLEEKDIVYTYFDDND